MRAVLASTFLLAAAAVAAPRFARAAPPGEWSVGIVVETGARGEILPCT